MAAAPITPPPVSADDELVYESLPCIRVYKNRVERYFGSEFVPASTDAGATGVASRDVVISANVSARLYLPRVADDAKLPAKLPVLVYFHGGGLCIGSAFNPIFHAYFNALAGLANALVVSVEYRLAPEHPVPAAYADSWDALVWVVSHLASAGGDGDRDPWIAGHADFSRLYLGGESAGANIAHHMAMRAASEDALPHGARIRGLVMVHPYFLGTDRVPSDDLDPATRESLASLWRVVCPSSTAGDDDPLINPLVDGAPALASLACARVLVCVAEGDVLRDRGRAYYDRLRASGWPGEAEIWQASFKGHTFHFMEPCCEEAVAQDKVISDFLNR